MKILFRWLLIGVLVFGFVGCGGGGDAPITEQKSVEELNTPTKGENFSGIAQLGYISGGDVSLYKLSDLSNPIATTKTVVSTDMNEVGKFSFDNIVMEDNIYYLLTVTGGKDIDANDDGVFDKTPIELNGTIHALITKNELDLGIRINALTDMSYQDIGDSRDFNLIKERLNQSANRYLSDINNDGEIDYKDILLFNPTLDHNKTKISYKNILTFYASKLHNNASKKSVLSSLMYLDRPQIVVDKGLLQEVPFTLHVNIKNIPKDTSVKWFMNSIEKTTIDEMIVEGGIYSISAQLYKDSKFIKTVTTQVIATTKIEIGTLNIDVTKENNLSISDEPNSSLFGTKIVVPKGALHDNTKIIVKKSSVNDIPTTKGVSISDVLVMEPSGLTFDKPIQITMPYNKDFNLTNHIVRVARYSQGILDYLAPTFIDSEKHEITFETNHFSSFKLETNWGVTRYKENQSEIQYLEGITGLSYTNEEWEKILNTNFLEKTDLTLYDYIKTYMENRKIYDIIEDKKGLYGAIAINTLYPNANELGKSFEIWDNVKEGFELINVIQGTHGTLVKLSTGEIYTALLNNLSGLNIGLKDLSTDAGGFNPMGYSPLDIGESIIKSFNDTKNHTLMEQLLSNCTLDTKTDYGAYIDDMLSLQGIKWVADTTCRRYKAYKANKSKRDKEAIAHIEEVVKYLEAKNAEKNTEFSEYSMEIETSLNKKITIPFKMIAKQYNEDNKNDFNPKFSVTDETTKVNIISGTAFSNLVFTPINEFEGEFTGTITFNAPSKYGKYVYRFEYENDEWGFNDIGNMRIEISVKPEAIIQDISFEGSLNDNGDYKGSFITTFDKDNVEHSISFDFMDYNGNYMRSYNGKSFLINKNAFDKSELSNLQILVKGDSSFTYSFKEKTFEYDLKTLIEEAVEKFSSEEQIDTDGDGVLDLYDAFPHDINYQKDTDKDGMPDKWEEKYGFNPYDINDGLLDKNGNGITNIQEFKNNSHPLKALTRDELITLIKNYTDNSSDETNRNNLINANTSEITNMKDIFNDSPSFNLDISGWDVSSVTDMSFMFYNLENFNQDISNWDVSSVTDMRFMFKGTKSFTQDISLWQVDSVLDYSSFNDDSNLIGSHIPIRFSLTIISYSWEIAEWSPCSGACGTNNAFQSRTVTCKASNGTIAEDSQCSETKPFETQLCTLSECPIPNEEDITAPIITLNGEPLINLIVGDTYNELGAVTDDGSEVIITGVVDTSIADTYTIRYNATDTAGNSAIEKSRTIIVSNATQEDTTPPIITINDEATISLTVGDTYIEAGAITDDGSEVIITGVVDTSIADTYTIRYNATDTAGNEAIEKIRTITVTAQALSPVTLDIGNEISKEEKKTILIPINETDIDNRIDTVTCNSTPNTIDFINTTAIITINMPKYSDIQQFTMECIAYDSLSEELDRDSVVVTVSEIIPTPTSSKVKKTGQTTTYTNYDDGYYQKGISPSYTRDDTKQIVTDHVTGLQWQDNETISKQWVTTANYNAGNYSDTSGDTASTYCSDLTLGGYSDWRLPSVKELLFIVDNSKHSPSIDNQFQNTISNYYWSSTTFASNTSGAWFVYFSNGYTYNYYKDNSYYVRCVRAGQ